MKIETQFASPTPAVLMDEIVIVLRRKSGVRFDPALPGFHLYGTDIVQSALIQGFKTYVFDGPVVHNSLPRIKLGLSYVKAYRYMQRKWRSQLPIYTTVLTVTRSGWPLIRYWFREKRQYVLRWFGPRQARKRHDNPALIAKTIGYEFDNGAG